MRLLLGHDTTVAEWVGQRIGVTFCPPYTALGWIDDEGRLSIGFVFYSYMPGGNIEMAVASSGRWTRGVLAAVAHYAFAQAGASRITVHTKCSNERAIKVIRRAGFKMECICKQYYGDENAVQFRMIRSECKWLEDN